MDFDQMLAASSRREDKVPVCLDGRTLAEYERVQAGINERVAAWEAEQAEATERAAVDDRLGAGAPTPEPRPTATPEEQARLDELREKMRPMVQLITLRELPSNPDPDDPDRVSWRGLILAHPPRTDEKTGQRLSQDYEGVNSDTYYLALLRHSIVDPDMGDENRWQRFLVALGDRQFNRLTTAAAELNVREANVPFSPGDWENPPTSAVA